MTENTEKKHRTAGGSSAHIWSNCTGYLPLKQTLPPQQGTVHTEQGTKAHELVELVTDAFLQRKITGQSNKEIIELIKNYDDEEIVEAAMDCATVIWEEVLQGSITGKVYGIEDEFVLSERLDIGGWADFWAVWVDNRAKRVLSILDFKNGYVEVPITKNAQLACYAVAARKEFRDRGKDIDYATVHVFQPKAHTPYKSDIITSKQLDAWEKKFITAVEKAYTKPTYKLGDWCKFCHCRPVCPKYIASPRANTSLRLLDARVDGFPDPATVPDETLSKVIQAADEIGKFLKACKAHGIARHISGSPLPGLKVVRGSGKRTWVADTTDVEENLLKHGLTEIYKRKLKGIGEIEAQLKLEKGLTKKEASALLDDLTFKKLPAPSLVSEDDPRPAILSFDDLLPDLMTEIDDE